MKEWDYRFGGNGEEYLNSIQETTDGGFILGGYSESDSSGDKTETIIDTSLFRSDYWIIKINSQGNKEWDKSYGGLSLDGLTCLQQTKDGGYILGGSSMSDSSGDKSQSNWDTSGTTEDYWIIKVDSLGNKQWDKRFGGVNQDLLLCLHQTIDGGYILGGYSSSDSGYNKSQPNWDTSGATGDYWIIKIDSAGNKQWDKRFGGNNWDFLQSVYQTSDGGYILGGWTGSDSSEDITAPTKGGWDYWIVKTNSFGIKEWDKRIGGYNLETLWFLGQCTDNGFIFGGWSDSDSSGDKTENNWDTTQYTTDFWIVKTDSMGNIQWDKTFGGTDAEEELGNIFQTQDGGFLISGSSSSNMSGNKSENNLGPEQTWVIKTDGSGNKEWDKTIFTLADDEVGFAIQTNDGCYVIANTTYADIGGYKTQSSWNSSHDFWIVKFCDTTYDEGNISLLREPKDDLEIFPDPATNLITLQLQSQNNSIFSATITITNLLGKTVFEKTSSCINGNLREAISLDEKFTEGIYLVRVSSEEQQWSTPLVVVR